MASPHVLARPDVLRLLITASGGVRFGFQDNHRFSQTFLIEQDRTDGSFQVMTDICRTSFE